MNFLDNILRKISLRIFLVLCLLFSSGIARSGQWTREYVEVSLSDLDKTFEIQTDLIYERIFFSSGTKSFSIQNGSEYLFLNGEIIKCKNPVIFETSLMIEPDCLFAINHSFEKVIPGEKRFLYKRPYKKNAGKKFVVFLDPGHGGFDGGTAFNKVTEKEIVLTIARQLRLLFQFEPDIEVYLSREEDFYVELDERPKMANLVQADLFISLHLNSGQRPGANGYESFVLNPNPSNFSAKLLAKHENKYFPANEDISGLNFILSDLSVNKFSTQSKMFARLLHSHFQRLLSSEDRGMKQAPFYVLYDLNMPGILLELAFLSNKDENLHLQDKSFQEKYSVGIIQAIKEYKNLINFN